LFMRHSWLPFLYNKFKKEGKDDKNDVKTSSTEFTEPADEEQLSSSNFLRNIYMFHMCSFGY